MIEMAPATHVLRRAGNIGKGADVVGTIPNKSGRAQIGRVTACAWDFP
jgi:hypothetical protein